MDKAPMARLARLAWLALPLVLGACEIERSTWTHVEGDVLESVDARTTYLFEFAHYDPLTDACIRFYLVDAERSPLFGGEEGAAHEVEIKGLGTDYRIESAYGSAEDGALCPLINSGGAEVLASGKIRFSDFSNATDSAAPCKVSFDLEFERVEDGERLAALTKKHPVALPGCPTPKEYVAEPSELDAAFGDFKGHDNVIVAAWDPVRETCAWARFIHDKSGVVEPNAVEAPGTWAYSGLGFAVMEREGCVAAEFIVPPLDLYPSTSDLPLDSSGRLEFVSSEGDQPCSLELDLRLASSGGYYWTPDELLLRASGLEVEGACEAP